MKSILIDSVRIIEWREVLDKGYKENLSFKDYHLGISLSERKFIHASSSKGVIIDDLNSGYYKEKFYIGGQL